MQRTLTIQEHNPFFFNGKRFGQVNKEDTQMKITYERGLIPLIIKEMLPKTTRHLSECKN